MLGDKAYDSNELRDELDQRGTKPVIPNRSNRKRPFSFSKRLYKLRWRNSRGRVVRNPSGALPKPPITSRFLAQGPGVRRNDCRGVSVATFK
jgi:IS5 family transposase